MIWVWTNTYFHTIFRGMNIHKSQLFWCELQGYIGPSPPHLQGISRGHRWSQDSMIRSCSVVNCVKGFLGSPFCEGLRDVDFLCGFPMVSMVSYYDSTVNGMWIDFHGVPWIIFRWIASHLELMGQSNPPRKWGLWRSSNETFAGSVPSRGPTTHCLQPTFASLLVTQKHRESS